MLLRQRLFYEAGIEMPLLTFDQNTDYKVVHQQLVADGYLHPHARILNIWRWFVDHEFSNAKSLTEFEKTPADSLRIESFEMNGKPWLTIYSQGEKDIAKEYLRPDGSIAIRLVLDDGTPVGLTPGVELVNASGQVWEKFKSLREFYRFWVTLLTPGEENVFLISDSRIIIPNFLDMGTRFFTFLQIHTPHSTDDRHFLAPIRSTYLDVMGKLNEFDAVSVNTDRQRSDVAKRFGAANNLFVITPAITPAISFGEQNHFPKQIATTARLEPVKRLDRAIVAFARLLERIPDAKFVIYGDGDLKQELQDLINELKIDNSVNLFGYDPRAREKLNDAVCYWNTSRHESYPLASLEAMSQGCPVVAYDVRYGPREQIKDGFNGFLVKEDDIETFVDRTISIMEDRELFNRLSKGAIETAQIHSEEKFLADTVKVIWEIVEKKPQRTKVNSVTITKQTIDFAKHLKWLRFQPNLALELDLELLIDSQAAQTSLSNEDFFLELVSPQSEESVRLPIQVSNNGNNFQLSARIPRSEIKNAISRLGELVGHVELRVGFVWGNSTWVHPLINRIRVITAKDGDPHGFAAESLIPKKLLNIASVRSPGRRLGT